MIGLAELDKACKDKHHRPSLELCHAMPCYASPSPHHLLCSSAHLCPSELASAPLPLVSSPLPLCTPLPLYNWMHLAHIYRFPEGFEIEIEVEHHHEHQQPLAAKVHSHPIDGIPLSGGIPAVVR